MTDENQTIIDGIQPEDVIAKVKTLTASDDVDLLNTLYDQISQRIYSYVAYKSVFVDKFTSLLGWFMPEAIVYRFNRLANEGENSYTQDGEAISWGTDPFDDFAKEINNCFAMEDSTGWKIYGITLDDTFYNQRVDAKGRMPIYNQNAWYWRTKGLEWSQRSVV